MSWEDPCLARLTQQWSIIPSCRTCGGNTERILTLHHKDKVFIVAEYRGTSFKSLENFHIFIILYWCFSSNGWLWWLVQWPPQLFSKMIYEIQDGSYDISSEVSNVPDIYSFEAALNRILHPVRRGVVLDTPIPVPSHTFSQESHFHRWNLKLCIVIFRYPRLHYLIGSFFTFSLTICLNTYIYPINAFVLLRHYLVLWH